MSDLMNTVQLADQERTALLAGIDNLLLTCMQLNTGDKILLVQEPPQERMYSATISHQVAERINQLGANATLFTHDIVSRVNDFSPELVTLMQQVEHTLFMSRIGDYSRFMPFASGSHNTQCYALDEAMFASDYASACYQLMSDLHRKLEAELMVAKRWRIRCPLGTDLAGTFCWPSLRGGTDEDFSLNMFPVTGFKPIPCNTARGKVALSRWLLPGGAASVKPAMIDLNGVVVATVADGLIEDFRGETDDVRAVNEHYDRVANTLGINRNRVHSWHAGLNPHTAFSGCMSSELERWEGISFASPRYLHLHTCGDLAPSEITWSVFNPTVEIDDEAWWQNGQLSWYQRADNSAMIQSVAGGDCLLELSRCIKV